MQMLMNDSQRSLVIHISLVLVLSASALAPSTSVAGVDSERNAGADSTFTEEVVVTASRYGQSDALNVTNISYEDLQLREPAVAFPLLLQGVPGVFSYSDAGGGLGYSYLKMRGFDQRRVGVLFNGIPFNDPEDHQIWWVDLPDLGSSLEDVQVQRGVTNSVGGMTAIGGTVNIVSRTLTEQPEGKLAVSTGSYGTKQRMLQYQTGDVKGSGFRSMLRLSQQESDGYRDRSGHDGWAVFWSGLYETESTVTQANLYTGREVTHHAWDAVPESTLRENRRANVETYHNAIDDFRQPHYELHNTWYLSENLEITNRLYYIRGEGFYENFKDGRSTAAYSLDRMPGYAYADSAEADLIRRKWVRKEHSGWVPHARWTHGNGRLLVGGDWYTFHSNHWGNVLWAEGATPDDFVEPWKYHQYTGDKDQYSLYANERWQFGPLAVTGDLHYQHKEYTFRQKEIGNFTGDLLNGYTVDYDFFNPKAALNYAAGEVAGGAVQAYGSWGINHREPTDNELFNIWEGADDLGSKPLFATSREVRNAQGDVQYVEWSNPYVQEERVTDYELGFSWQRPNLFFALGGYRMEFEDEIVAYGGVNDDGSSIRGNAEQTLHQGLEMELRARIAREHTLSLAASRSWDEFDTFIQYLDTDWDGTADTEVDNSGNPISLFPEYLISGNWDAQWTPQLRSRVRVHSTGKQYLDNTGDDARTIDAWATIDLSLWWDLSGLGIAGSASPTVFVHLRNLSDTEYETWGYYYGENWYTTGPGRNFATGVSANF